MKLSFIIPTFNRRDSLLQTLASIQEQIGPDEEILVVDDGSTDLTREHVAREYPRVRYLSQSHSGPGAARNLGLREATGRFVFPFDSDWLLRPAMLSVLRRLLHEPPAPFLLFPCLSYPGGRLSAHVRDRCLVSEEDLLLERRAELTAVFDRGWVQESGFAYPGYRSGGEMFFWMDLVRRQPAVLLSPVLTLYRTDVGGRISTAAHQLAHAREMAEISERWAERLTARGLPRQKKLLAAAVYRVLAGDLQAGREGFARCEAGWKSRTARLLAPFPTAFRLGFRLWRFGQKGWHG